MDNKRSYKALGIFHQCSNKTSKLAHSTYHLKNYSRTFQELCHPKFTSRFGFLSKMLHSTASWKNTARLSPVKNSV